MLDVSQKALVTRAHDEMIGSDLGFEQVLLDSRKGMYYGLNPAARYIFSLLDQPKAVGELIDAVTVRYRIPRERAETDIRHFLQAMTELQLVRIDSQD
jgi:hypothetical protein